MPVFSNVPVSSFSCMNETVPYPGSPNSNIDNCISNLSVLQDHFKKFEKGYHETTQSIASETSKHQLERKELTTNKKDKDVTEMETENNVNPRKRPNENSLVDNEEKGSGKARKATTKTTPTIITATNKKKAATTNNEENSSESISGKSPNISNNNRIQTTLKYEPGDSYCPIYYIHLFERHSISSPPPFNKQNNFKNIRTII